MALRAMQPSDVQGCDMPRTPEDDLPVAKAYKKLLRKEVEAIGRDRVAGLADINPSTVHRNINEGNLTYTTALKLRDAIAAAYAEDHVAAPRAVPPPFVAVVSDSHYQLCELLGKLHELDYEAFASVMEDAIEKQRDALLERANRRVANPLRNSEDTDDEE